MTKGISLHVGLNAISSAHYGTDGALAACEYDAKDMQKIAKRQSFSSTLLLTKRATHAAVTKAMRGAAQSLRSGDIFLLTYAGHGGQVPDTNGAEEEDGQDETWVLYDRQLVDDELYALWAEFEAGVRILMISDSCHSGTVARAALYVALSSTAPFAREFAAPRNAAPRFRVLPEKTQAATYRKHKKLYDKVQRDYPQGERVSIGASLLLLSGCQDHQLSSDGAKNGAFTEALKRIWADGGFDKGHRAFHKAIAALMPPWQTPNYFKVGANNIAFERQRPFSI